MCTYSVATKEELDLLVQMRLEFNHDIHPEFDDAKLDELRVGAHAYIKGQLAADAYVGFFGKVGDEVVCSSALLIYNLPPLREAHSRKIGHVMNFFTRKEHRKKGYGLGLMTFMQEFAKMNGFHRLVLTATEDGYPLYVKAGYIDANKAMEYNLSD